MKRLITLASAALLLGGSAALAVPAMRGVRTVTQPDGTTLSIQKIGDEFHHYTFTADGLLLTGAADGTYCYARLDANGTVLSTGVKAVDAPLRSVLPADVATMEAVKAMPRMAKSRRIPQSGVGLDVTTFPGKGSPNVLILLVEYSDVPFCTPDAHSYFDGMLNEKGFSQYGGTGSAKDYFVENSMGQFTPNFVCYGPVKLPKKRAYYGGNDWNGDDKAAEDMVVDAINILDPEVDFSIFDNDGDGKVDNVYVIYAGQGEASYGSEDTVWPHSWDLSNGGKSFRVDGVTVDHYACSNEWLESTPDGIGTFVHEFSHVLGLPDLYHTQEVASYTPDSYSVLDYGPYNNDSRTPPAYSAYERNAMQWIEPVVIDGPMDGELEHILESNKCYLIPTDKDTEFFLLENRQQRGWDKYIPGHGMLIWHIDYVPLVWAANAVNNTRYHQYVDIEEACGTTGVIDSVKKGYPFPGANNVTSFTDDTTPGSKTWSGQSLGLPITEIAENDGLISFAVAGGGTPAPAVPMPDEADKLEKGKDYFVASWQPVENAMDYEVTVTIADGGEPFTVEANMGNGANYDLPEGWISTTSDVYSSTSNYGKASPSLKLSTTGAHVLSPLFDEDVTGISYWRKGQTTSGGSAVKVYGLVDGEWVELFGEEPKANDPKVITLENIPAGVRQVKIEYIKVKGNLALDDVTISVGNEDMPLEAYTNVSTGGATTLRVSDLPKDVKTFRYKVRSCGETRKSAYSKAVTVTLGDVAVDDVAVDASEAEYFDMLGRRVLRPAKGSILLERRGTSVRKVMIR